MAKPQNLALFAIGIAKSVLPRYSFIREVHAAEGVIQCNPKRPYLKGVVTFNWRASNFAPLYFPNSAPLVPYWGGHNSRGEGECRERPRETLLVALLSALR